MLLLYHSWARVANSTCAADPAKLESITIGAQTDGLLRVTLTVNTGDGSQAVVLYLAPEANE